jgi:Flp pilus assembly pilin Flp
MYLLSGHYALKGAMACLEQFRRDERGATAIEYGLIAVAVCLAISGPIATIAQDLMVPLDVIANAF